MFMCVSTYKLTQGLADVTTSQASMLVNQVEVLQSPFDLNSQSHPAVAFLPWGLCPGLPALNPDARPLFLISVSLTLPSLRWTSPFRPFLLRLFCRLALFHLLFPLVFL